MRNHKPPAQQVASAGHARLMEPAGAPEAEARTNRVPSADIAPHPNVSLARKWGTRARSLISPPEESARGDGPIERLMAPIRRLVGWLSARPTLWNIFRRVFELNFREEKRVIGRELMPAAYRINREGRKPRVLDLGCGTGELAPSFLRAGYNYVGIDIEPERMEYARKTHRPGRFHVMDASALKYPDGYFDQILVTGVLHHLPDQDVRAIVREMKRVLRPEGRALVMEDIALRGSLNLLGAFVHLADAGAYIRRPSQYAPLFKPYFNFRDTYPVRCGVCDYQAFVLEPADT